MAEHLCGGVAKRAPQYSAENKPGLMFVHFSDPNEYGHSHGWLSADYMRAVHPNDRCLATLSPRSTRVGSPSPRS